jgi:Domain of unknown function (DUF4345)
MFSSSINSHPALSHPNLKKRLFKMTLETRPNYLLRSVLAVFGAAIIFLGLNVGLGGIQTLGWQGGSVNFINVTDPQIFAVRDNHIRFIGGVWLALGVLMFAGSLAFQHLRPVLVALTFLIFIGGLARLSGGDPALLISADILPSFLFEVLIAPLLGVWFSRAEKQ